MQAETETQTPPERVTTTQQTLPTPPISPTRAAEIPEPTVRQPSPALLSTDVGIASGNTFDTTDMRLPGIHTLLIPLSFRQNFLRPPALPEFEFDSSPVTSTQWSPSLAYRHPNLQREQRREAYIAYDHTSVSNSTISSSSSSSSNDSDTDDDVNIRVTPFADSVPNEAATSTANPLPPQLRRDADLAEKFTHAIVARIAALRLLLLDVDGAPIVPLVHLQTQFAATTAIASPVLYSDHAGEFASVILRRLVAAKRRVAASQPPDGNQSSLDHDGSSDGEINPEVSEFLPVVRMRSLRRRGGQARRTVSFDNDDDADVEASEIGADTQRRRIYSEIAPECQCEPCLIESTLNAPFAYLLRTDAGYNGDPVKIACHNEFCESEVMKKDYWRRETRRMSAWENRFREFARVHRVCGDGVDGENCGGGSRRHRHAVWCGYNRYARRWLQPIENDWSDVGGDGDEDSDSDGDDESSDESSDESNFNPGRFAVNESDEDEEDDDYDEDNESDDDENFDEDDADINEEDEDGENEDTDEEIDDETREKIFLEDFMAKLQELFGLLELHEKLQQIPV
ncbi:hypothetical protein HK100_005544, partial [Physocladia obscura]